MYKRQIPLVLSFISPKFSSFTYTTLPGPSSQRIGVKLPLFPESKGYVGTPYRPTPPCRSDTDPVTAGSSPILSLLHLLGVCVVPSKSPAIPTPIKNVLTARSTYTSTSKPHHLRLRLLLLLLLLLLPRSRPNHHIGIALSLIHI